MDYDVSLLFYKIIPLIMAINPLLYENLFRLKVALCFVTFLAMRTGSV